MIEKINVGVLGATGVVGQQMVQLLSQHPWFQITFLAASPASAGKSYIEAVKNKWHLADPIPSSIASLNVYSLEEMDEAKKKCRVLFSGLTTESASEYEGRYAAQGFSIISNASSHRKDPKVPMIIPEVNGDHLKILPKKGFIVVKPNCSIQSIMLPLHPLHLKFGVKKIHMTTLQAISGAGLPGVPSLYISDNIIPHIQGEEEKSEWEPLKIWGSVEDGCIKNDEKIKISATCNRVPVVDGHLACVSVEFEKKPTREEILTCWETFEGLKLPSSPKKPVIYFHEHDRPQPRLDRHLEKGMAVSVGRLRPCPLLDYRFTALSHNTIRGASGGSILTAELLHQNHLL
jgi:aspartate-semialdehyde dehydrogenase